MRRHRDLFLWPLLGIAGALLLAWAYPRAFPFHPDAWSVTRDEAVAIALSRLNVLGDPVKNPYIAASLSRDDLLERRLELALDAGDSLDRLRATGLPKRVLVWDVLVYPPGGLRDDWVYRAQVSPKGEVLLLQLNLDPQAKGATVPPQEARNRADTFLVQQGFDLSRYGEPELRSRQLTARTDLSVRYPDRTLPPGTPPGEGRHGVQVHFAGERLAGFSFWFDDPQERALQTAMQPTQFSGLVQLLTVYLLAALVGVPFLKRYHEGEIGVERPVQIFLAVLVAGLFLVLLTAQARSQTVGFGIATREQTTWAVAVISLVFWVLPYAVLAFVGWSVGESVCRERWGHKLAAFDALFQRQWGTATVARSSLRGFAGGVALAGMVAALLVALRRGGASPLVSLFQSFDSGWPGLELVASFLAYGLPPLLAVILFLLPLTVNRTGVAVGLLVTMAVGAAVAFPFAIVVPIRWGFLVSAVAVLGPALIFLAADLLAALSAGMVSQLLLFGYPLLTAQDTRLRVHGWSALALAAVPLLVSLRHLRSGRSFQYRYEDVPPHVRRIAERERQRVELETARRIQSSILPDLPPSLNGVEIAHAYLPASEVGGDFYDVLALEDGRLAIAVGDVAGHGVSSGLVMSMAKSALAVQVTFDPEVSAVFNTLNRTVFQTARKRLLATLCYALLDPVRRELIYASAGHLFPYRVTVEGAVEALESVAYPLGVRGKLVVEPRTARLSAGDTLFLFSDGIVEARPEGSEDVFGFERLEQSLAVHARLGVERLRDAVLADVARFTAHAPREDDQTIVVLRLE
jgi:hypothetical protein